MMWELFVTEFCKVQFLCYHGEPNWLGWVVLIAFGFFVVGLCMAIVGLCMAILSLMIEGVRESFSRTDDRKEERILEYNRQLELEKESKEPISIWIYVTVFALIVFMFIGTYFKG